MIPRIAKRGYSFKGAGQYYLHDKGKDTSERVAWTHIHNLPTDDPELAMNWMAYTAMNSEQLKIKSGTPLTGRKSQNKPVYAFSLGWQPEQNPSKEHMLALGFDALALLGLTDHETVFVAHSDTKHPHVHVVTNLVHPETGKTLRPQNDRLRLSTWAEQYEKEHDKIYCHERVKNNARRRGGEKIKHRETKIDHSLLIQNIYNQTKSAQDFEKSIQDKGFTLAKGDRRGFVLVDEEGKIFSLSRQLKEQRAKDIKLRLQGLDELPNAKKLSEDRQYFMRDDYEANFQKQIVDEAIKEDAKKEQSKEQIQPKTKSKQNKTKPHQSFAEELDKIRASEEQADKKRLKKEQELNEFYNRKKYLSDIEQLEAKISKTRGRTTRKELNNQLNDLKNTLDNVDSRLREQGIDPKTGNAYQNDKDTIPEAPKDEVQKKRGRNRSTGRDLDF